jgi:hypothetical protein
MSSWSAAELAVPSPALHTRALDRLVLGGACAVILSYVLEAPLRFGLNLIGLDFAIYARDLLTIAFVGMMMLPWQRPRPGAGLVAIATAVLCVHTLIGVLMLDNVRQPLFGLKIFLTFLLGLVVGPLLRDRARQVAGFASVCYALTALGVLVNVFVEYPWTGLSFETAVGTTELSRKWWTAGEARLAGFTRASYLAAQMMLVSLVPILTQRPRWWLRVTLLALAGVVIALTTSKAAYTGLAALTVCHLLLLGPSLTPLLVGFIASLYVTCLALPIICVQLDAPTGRIPSFAASFVERMQDMWPKALALLDGPLAVLVGRGLGGIGSPQQLGDARWFNSADNMMLFVLVTFGVAGPTYFGALALRLSGRLADGPRDHTLSWASAWMAIMLAVGLTSQMIEDPISMFTLGVGAASLFGPTERR